MYISRIVVRNYRSFERLDVALGDGVTCILGENNTGKTNLIHALRLVTDSTLASYFRQLDMHDIHAGTNISTPEQVVVAVEFTDYRDQVNELALVGCWEVSEDTARLCYRFRPRKNVRDEIGRGEREPEGLTLEDYHWELTGGGDIDPAEVTWDQDIGKAIRFSHLQSFLVVTLQAMRNVGQDLQHTRSSPLARLFSATDIPAEEQDSIVNILNEANRGIENSATISATGKAISSSFKATTGEAYDLGVKLGLSDPSFASIAQSLTLLLTDQSIANFEPARNGLGLNNILYTSMLLEYLARRANKHEAAGQLLLFEEPEAHIHPQLQRVLYQALSDRGVQTIITTHSTHISSRAPIASYITLTRTGEGISGSSYLEDKLEHSELADLERYLDATRSTLLFARRVMLVEGPAELFLIPPLVKKVMGIDLDRHGISVIPIHGVHFSSYAKLFSEGALPKKCAIVADMDLGPRDSADSDLAENDAGDPGVPKRLTDLAGEYVSVFACNETFEIALAVPGLLSMLGETAHYFGATRVARKLKAAPEILGGSNMTKTKRKALLKALGRTVLATAKRFGKARFAQVAARNVEQAEEIPAYIREAVNWLVE